MAYCEGSQSATVIYQFGGGAERKYIASVTPIEVAITNTPRIAYTEFNPTGAQYTFRYKTGGNLIYGVGFAFIALETTPEGGQDSQSVIIDFNKVVTRSFLSAPVEYLGSSPYSPPSGQSQPSWNATTITVRHEGIIIYTDQGNNGCTFQVLCDCDLEDDRELAGEFPGYECVPYTRLAKELRQTREQFLNRSRDRFNIQ